MFENNESIYLRAFEIDDYKLINKWRNDPEITEMVVGNKLFISSAREKAWVEEKIHDDRTEMYFAICATETKEMVGFTSVRNINWRNKSAYWGGVTIGKEYWKKGYAKATNIKVLKFVFDELGINRVYTDFLKEHEISSSIFKKLGFTIEGIARQEVFKGGKFHDIVRVSLLKREYDELKKEN